MPADMLGTFIDSIGKLAALDSQKRAERQRAAEFEVDAELRRAQQELQRQQEQRLKEQDTAEASYRQAVLGFQQKDLEQRTLATQNAATNEATQAQQVRDRADMERRKFAQSLMDESGVPFQRALERAGFAPEQIQAELQREASARNAVNRQANTGIEAVNAVAGMLSSVGGMGAGSDMARYAPAVNGTLPPAFPEASDLDVAQMQSPAWTLNQEKVRATAQSAEALAEQRRALTEQTREMLALNVTAKTADIAATKARTAQINQMTQLAPKDYQERVRHNKATEWYQKQQVGIASFNAETARLNAEKVSGGGAMTASQIQSHQDRIANMLRLSTDTLRTAETARDVNLSRITGADSIIARYNQMNEGDRYAYQKTYEQALVDKAQAQSRKSGLDENVSRARTVYDQMADANARARSLTQTPMGPNGKPSKTVPPGTAAITGGGMPFPVEMVKSLEESRRRNEARVRPRGRIISLDEFLKGKR